MRRSRGRDIKRVPDQMFPVIEMTEAIDLSPLLNELGAKLNTVELEDIGKLYERIKAAQLTRAKQSSTHDAKAGVILFSLDDTDHKLDALANRFLERILDKFPEQADFIINSVQGEPLGREDRKILAFYHQA